MIDELFSIIEDRKQKMPEDSYVASLFRKGENRVLQKVGEETMEVLLAAKKGSKPRIIQEIADLEFHILVLLSWLNLRPKDIRKELKKRRKK